MSLPFLREYRGSIHTIMGQAINPVNVVDSFDLDIHFGFNCAGDIKYFGMSGSQVWNLNLHLAAKAEDWRPDWATFAGVVQRWIPSKNCIIATRAEIVKEFLSDAIARLRDQWVQIEQKT